MPKFIVRMNMVKAKTTSFIIEAESEDAVFDGLEELNPTFFQKNCDWVTSEYEPPIIDNVKQIDDTENTPKQKKKIQIKFDKVINSLKPVE